MVVGLLLISTTLVSMHHHVQCLKCEFDGMGSLWLECL